MRENPERPRIGVKLYVILVVVSAIILPMVSLNVPGALSWLTLSFCAAAFLTGHIHYFISERQALKRLDLLRNLSFGFGIGCGFWAAWASGDGVNRATALCVGFLMFFFLGICASLLIFSLLRLVGVFADLALDRFRAFIDSGQCQRCGYDLTGNVSGVCPECGTVVPPPPAERAMRSHDALEELKKVLDEAPSEEPGK